MVILSTLTRTTDDFQVMFAHASSVDEYWKLILSISELDLPVVQWLRPGKRQKLQEMSTPAWETEQKLDPWS